MCGMIGYVGSAYIAKKYIIDGLRRLEHRGTEAAGVAIQSDQTLSFFKQGNPLVNIQLALDEIEEAKTAIGHTHWLIGEQMDRRSHLHGMEEGRFAIVFNGTVQKWGRISKQQEDSDIETFFRYLERGAQEGRSIHEMLQTFMQEVEGIYAFICLDVHTPNILYAAHEQKNLCIAVSESAMMIGAEQRAFTDDFTEVIHLDSRELAIVQPKQYTVLKDGHPIEKEQHPLHFQKVEVALGNYADYMTKEMNEQPGVLCELSRQYLKDDGTLDISPAVVSMLQKAKRLVIIGSGTSYHAALIGKRMFERMAQLPTDVYESEEFLYNTPQLVEETVCLAISRSGETPSILESIKKMNRYNVPTIVITNEQQSSVVRFANESLWIHAGPELGITSTKVFVAKIAFLSMLAIALGRSEGMYDTFDVSKKFAITAQAIHSVLNKHQRFRTWLPTLLMRNPNITVIARGLDYAVAQEGALKLRQIGSLHADAYVGGELRYSPLALVQEKSIAIALITNKRNAKPMRKDIAEIRSYGTKVFVISMEGLDEEGDDFVLPLTHPIMAPLVGIIPFQILGYYAAQLRRLDVNQPLY